MTRVARQEARPIRLVVAGSGAMARYHVTRFSALPAVDIVGCYDRSRERAGRFGEEHRIAMCSDDIGEILDRTRPDGITVAVADSQHYEITATAIRRGVPVFLEKPFTVDILQAEHIIELQQRFEVPVMINFSKLNYPALWGMVRAVEAGRPGKLQYLDLRYLQSWVISDVWGEWWKMPRWLWRISSSHGGGGALRDLGSHLLYLALRLGGPVLTVDIETGSLADRGRAVQSGYSCDMNDTFTMHLEFSRGLQARISGSFAEPGHVNTVYARAEGADRILEVTADRDKERMLMWGADGLERGSRDSRVGLAGWDPDVVGADLNRQRHDLRTYRFRKVYSTYDTFVTGLRSARSWQDYEPSASIGLTTQRLLSGVAPRPQGT